MTSWVADMSGARPGGAALKAAGCIGVVRYAGALTASFNITGSEVADLAAYGLPVGIVCEQRTGDILGGRDVGQQMARAAVEDTRAAGLPDGLVYAAGDEDLTLGGPTKPGSPGDVQMTKVHDTLVGFADVLGWANVGFYGSYYAIDWLIAKAVPVATFWQTQAWSRGNVHPRAALLQYAAPPQTIPGGCDYNAISGDWRPRTAQPTPTPTPPPGGHVHAVTGDLENLHPTLLARLQAMADGEGTDIHVNSGHRSHAKQIELWNDYQHYLAYGSPWAALAARPGTSLHEGNPSAYALGLAADISIPGYQYARTKLGGHIAARYGLADAIPTEGWHFQGVEARNLPATNPTPAPTSEAEFIVNDMDFRPGLSKYPSPRSLSATVLQAALARHGEWINLPGATPQPSLTQMQTAVANFQDTHLGSHDLIVGAHTKAALAVEPHDCRICLQLGRYPYK